MKAKIIMKTITALLLSACSSTFFAYAQGDDLYYVPGKTAPQKTNEVAPQPAKVADKKSDEGLTDYEKYRRAMENGELKDTAVNPEAGKNFSEIYNAADTLEPNVKSEAYYGDGEDTYIYNNHYYASRLHRFHGSYYWNDPWFYDPWYSWYDPWYDPYGPSWSFSIGWGHPYYSSSWYWRSSSYNRYYGGYYGYYGYTPYHTHHHNGWYDHYYASSSSRNGYYGSALRTPSTPTYRTYPARTTSSGQETRRTYSGSSDGRTDGRTYQNPAASGRVYSRDARSSDNGSSRPVYTRRATVDQGRTYTGSGENRTTTRSGTNRSTVNENGRSTENRTYVPQYTQPRTYSRPSYNENNRYTESSRGSSSSSGSRTYSTPRSSESSSGSSSSSGRTYSRGSSSDYSSGRSYSGGSSSSSGSSYSGSSSSSGSNSSGSSSSSGGSSSSSGRSSSGSSGGRR